MQINTVEAARNIYEDGNIRQGTRTVKSLLVGEEGRPDNYKLGFSYGEGGSDWSTPRHRHLFDQVRHPVEGDYSIGKNRVLPAGWVGYFPESAYYGPQVMSPNLRMIVLQFGGPTGKGFYSNAQRKRAIEKLGANGVLKNGIYQYVGADGRTHNQDAGEALWEAARDEPAEYPAARYDDLVLMNPASYAWQDATAGVAVKRLGTFSEREIKIALWQVESGADFTFAAEPANEVLFVKSGTLELDGAKHEALTAFGSDAAEGPVTMRAVEDCELFSIKMPTF